MDEIAICAKCQHLDRNSNIGNHVFWNCHPKEDINYQTGKPIDCDCRVYNPEGKCKFYIERKGEEDEDVGDVAA